MSVIKWSGTLAHPNHCSDLIGATICAFVHFAYIYSQRTIVLADIQGVSHVVQLANSHHVYSGTHAQISPGIEGLILFDVMTHTTAG